MKCLESNNFKLKIINQVMLSCEKWILFLVLDGLSQHTSRHLAQCVRACVCVCVAMASGAIFCRRFSHICCHDDSCYHDYVLCHGNRCCHGDRF